MMMSSSDKSSCRKRGNSSHNRITLKDWFLLSGSSIGSSSSSNSTGGCYDLDDGIVANDSSNNNNNNNNNSSSCQEEEGIVPTASRDGNNMLMSTTSPQSSSSLLMLSTPSIPRILLLDGGVSTHLEEQIQRQQQQQQQHTCTACNSTSLNNNDSIPFDHNDKTNNNNNNNSNNNNYDVFQYKELWSSSLLLSNEGRQQIYNGHIDWIQHGMVNVITTVTYQSHYISHLWPTTNETSICLPISDDTNDNNQLQQQQQQPVSMTTKQSILSDEIMDRMWYDGIQLANKAINDSSTQDINNNNNNNKNQPLYVIASSGCYGSALPNGAEYTGSYINDDMNDINDLQTTIYNFHLRKIQTILRTNNNNNNNNNNTPSVDGIAIETVPSIIECKVLCNLLQQSNDSTIINGLENVACYISLSCQNGYQLNDGSLLCDALQIFHTIPITTIQAIGFNCCSIMYIPNLLRILIYDIVQYTPQRGIVVYPNSGETWDGITKQWISDRETSSSSSSIAKTFMKCIIYEVDRIWEDINRTNPNLIKNKRKPSILIGGCCRTTVETIAELRTYIDEYMINHE